MIDPTEVVFDWQADAGIKQAEFSASMAEGMCAVLNTMPPDYHVMFSRLLVTVRASVYDPPVPYFLAFGNNYRDTVTVHVDPNEYHRVLPVNVRKHSNGLCAYYFGAYIAHHLAMYWMGMLPIDETPINVRDRILSGKRRAHEMQAYDVAKQTVWRSAATHCGIVLDFAPGEIEIVRDCPCPANSASLGPHHDISCERYLPF